MDRLRGGLNCEPYRVCEMGVTSDRFNIVDRVEAASQAEHDAAERFKAIKNGQGNDDERDMFSSIVGP